MNDNQISAPALKIGTAWAAVGITSWSDVAAFLAAVYTTLIMGEWLWKKVGRPFAERRGWVSRRLRRSEDSAGA